MNNNYNLIIIVISSRSILYDKLIKQYWIPFLQYINNNNIGITILFMFGHNTPVIDLNIPNENLYISNVEDSYIPGILIKTIETMNFINATFTYKHILRTNLSSFFILNNLISNSSSLSKKNIYAGVIGNHNNILFASGAGFWMSKDIVEFILTNKNSIDYFLPDDVAIGKLLNTIKITPMPRYDLTNNVLYDDNAKARILNNITDNNHYHIRIKNDNNRNIDLDFIGFFTKKLYKN